MNPLISFPIDLTRLVGVMGDIHDQLAGIRIALERIAGPVPSASDPPRPAGLSDLRHTGPTEVERIKGELQIYAENNSVLLDSEAFVESIIDYERQVAQVYGDEAIKDLPWNKAAGGPIFQSYSDSEQKRAEAKRQRSGPGSSHAEPAPHPRGEPFA